MKYLFLIITLILSGCSTPELKSIAFADRLPLNSNLKFYFLDQNIFSLYNLKNYQTSQLLTLQSDVSSPSYDVRKKYFAFKDQGERRLTIFSVVKKQVVFQKNFNTHRRLGFVKFSPNSKSVAISWRSGGPKSVWHKGEDIDDSLLIIRMNNGQATENAISKKVVDEVTDLEWVDDKNIITATYDGNFKKSIMVSTNIKNRERKIIKTFSFKSSSETEADLSRKCGYNLKYSMKDPGEPITDIVSIDKFLKSGKTKSVIPVSQGLKTHPHGNNFRLSLTQDCNVGLLYHRKRNYAIDMKNNKITPLFNGYVITSYAKE